MKKTAILSALLAALAAQASAFDFRPAVQADGRFSWDSQQASAKSSFGGTGSLFAIPAMGFSPRLSLSPVLAAIAQGRGLVIEEDSFFVRRFTFLAKPTLRWKADDNWDLRLWAGAKRAVNEETDSEAWSLGLYDWEEYSAGIGADWKPGRAWLEKAALGLELQHRAYPNWHESGVAIVGNHNYYSKDYWGTRLALDMNSPRKERWGWDGGLSLLLRDYSDSLQVRKDGTLDPDVLRQDLLTRLDFNPRMPLGETFNLVLNVNLDWNASNQNFFDPTQNQPVMDFYGYWSFGGGPTLAWAPKGPEGPTLSAGATLTNRTYTGRLIQDPDGTYRQGKQADLEQHYSLDGRWPFWLRGLAAVSSIDYLNVLSNQGYQVRVRNTYDLFTATLGLQYKL